MALDEHAVDPQEESVALRARIARTVRDLRSRDGRSLADVAAEAGIGKSTLHAIESGDANPGIETLWALARALDVPFGHLLDPPSPTVRVVRSSDVPRITSEAGVMQANLLAITTHQARVELYELTLQPGPLRDAEGHTAGTVEHVFVTQGRLRVGPRGETAELQAGDLATFPGDGAHRYQALEPDTKAMLLLEYR